MKYGNKKVQKKIGDEVYIFDSRKEYRRFEQLYSLLKKGKIKDLVLQPEYVLLEPFEYDGIKERGVKYIADFRYTLNGKTIVEDVKSAATAKDKTYRVKRKWFLSKYGKDLTFREV